MKRRKKAARAVPLSETELKKRQLRNKKRKDRMKRRMIVFVFLFLCAGVIFTVLKAPFFNIKSIICIGQQQLSQEEIIKAANVRTGTNIFSVNITAAKRRIAAIPAVSASNVRRIFPNKIKIWVREAEEAAFVKTKNGAVLIGTDGKILKAVKPDGKETKELAELCGIEAASEKPGEFVVNTDELAAKKAVECLGILDKLELLKGTKKIDVSDLSDIKINYQDRLNILPGSYDNIEYKLNFIKKVISENISEYERANLDYRGEKLYVGPMEDVEKTSGDKKDTKQPDGEGGGKQPEAAAEDGKKAEAVTENGKSTGNTEENGNSRQQ